MGTKLLISNLPLNVDSSDLEDMFTVVGDVCLASVECDALTGQSKGVGRVEMSNADQARDGIDHFHGHNTRGHVLVVREDKPHIPIARPPTTAKGRLLQNSNGKRR